MRLIIRAFHFQLQIETSDTYNQKAGTNTEPEDNGMLWIIACRQEENRHVRVVIRNHAHASELPRHVHLEMEEDLEGARYQTFIIITTSSGSWVVPEYFLPMSHITQNVLPSDQLVGALTSLHITWTMLKVGNSVKQQCPSNDHRLVYNFPPESLSQLNIINSTTFQTNWMNSYLA
jgi:hypothetical protein